MKKLLLFILTLTLTVPVWAQKDISVGAFGGLNYPIVQDDAGSGSDFGIKAKFSPIPMIAASAFFESRSIGDVTFNDFGSDETIGGGKVTSFGIEALLGNTGGGPGPHFYWAVGISSYKWTRDNWEDVSKVGYHIGPGIEMILPSNIGLEVRAKFELGPTDGEGARKNGIILVGANYHIGII